MARLLGIALVLGLAAATAAVSTQAPPPAGAGQTPSAREQVGSALSRAGLRPAVMGRSGGIAAGHPLTTAAGFEILLKGGNAFDAGVAMLLAGGVLEQDLYSLGGEALVLVYPKREGKVTAVVGQGWAPKAVDVDWYLKRKKTLQGAGLDPSVVPGALHAALTVLETWGTMSFEQVSARALDYAEHGFPIRASTVAALRREQKFFQNWPVNQRYWSKPDGSAFAAGETITLTTTARTLRRMVEAERAASGGGREAGVRAARDRFYKGDIAREMVAFLHEHDSPWQYEDFAEFYARVEEPAKTTYRGYTVYKHGFGSQGPSLLQTLNILEHFDLKAMKLDSADYVHTVTEAMKLAYADRDSYYADPEFVKVPSEGLLSKDYAKERASHIDPKHASKAFIAGDPLKYDSTVKRWAYWKADIADGTKVNTNEEPIIKDQNDAFGSLGLDSAGVSKDTTHMSAIDKDGNVFDVTPSGGWIGGAVILGDTGIGMSVRGEQFFLDKTRANQIRPHARPRYTLTPSLVFKGAAPMMALGTPGGDNQDQTILQALLDVIEFWDDWYPNLHLAFEWPRFQTLHFYGSFWPHNPGFNKLNLEATIPDAVFDELRARGHSVTRIKPFGMSGCATAVMIDPATQNRFAAADPRRDCYAIAY